MQSGSPSPHLRERATRPHLRSKCALARRVRGQSRVQIQTRAALRPVEFIAPPMPEQQPRLKPPSQSGIISVEEFAV